jgi:uncharacterized protein (TIGR03067 family)
MLWKTIATSAAVLLLACTGYLAVANENESKALQGTWEASKGDEKMKMVIDGKKFTLEFGGKTVNGTFTIDPAKKPMAMDMLITEGSDAKTQEYKGKTAKAIYEIDGTKLKWCANEPGKDERPTEFSNDATKQKALCLTFERAKK